GGALRGAGRRRMSPPPAMPAYRFPRKRSSARALAGDSTITSGLAIKSSGHARNLGHGRGLSLRYHFPQTPHEPAPRLPAHTSTQFELRQTDEHRGGGQPGEGNQIVQVAGLLE